MNISKLKAELQSFFSERKKTSKELEKLKQRRDFLQNSPLPKSDVVEIVKTAVSRHEERMHQAFDRWAQNLLPKNDPRQTETLCTGVSPLNLARIGDEAVFQSILLVAARDLLLAEAERAIHNANWPKDVGPGRVDRSTELAQLDRQISGLEKTLADLDREATAAGIGSGGGPYAK